MHTMKGLLMFWVLSYMAGHIATDCNDGDCYQQCMQSGNLGGSCLQSAYTRGHYNPVCQCNKCIQGDCDKSCSGYLGYSNGNAYGNCVDEYHCFCNGSSEGAAASPHEKRWPCVATPGRTGLTPDYYCIGTTRAGESTPYCLDLICVQCLINYHCIVYNSPRRLICDTQTTHLCVQCLGDRDCPASRPTCDNNNNMCIDPNNPEDVPPPPYTPQKPPPYPGWPGVWPPAYPGSGIGPYLETGSDTTDSGGGGGDAGGGNDGSDTTDSGGGGDAGTNND